MDEPIDFEDFRQEMWLAVHEGALLFELPSGAKDYTHDGIVQHGPWPPEECSRCLLTWFDHGWVTLFVAPEHLELWTSRDDLTLDQTDKGFHVVVPDRARAVLAEPQMWTSDRPEGLVTLNPAAHAPTSDFRQLWLDAVKPGR